jgi:hypothetical protein
MPENQAGHRIRRWSARLQLARFFQAAVSRGLSRLTIRLTSDLQQSKPILDENPRKKPRAKWQ